MCSACIPPSQSWWWHCLVWSWPLVQQAISSLTWTSIYLYRGCPDCRAGTRSSSICQDSWFLWGGPSRKEDPQMRRTFEEMVPSPWSWLSPDQAEDHLALVSGHAVPTCPSLLPSSYPSWRTSSQQMTDRHGWGMLIKHQFVLNMLRHASVSSETTSDRI